MPPQLLRRLAAFRLVQGCVDRAIQPHALVDLENTPGRHGPDRFHPGVEIGPPWHVVPADLEHILKPRRGEHAGMGTVAFQDGIGRHGGAVEDVAQGRRRDPCQVQAFLTP